MGMSIKPSAFLDGRSELQKIIEKTEGEGIFPQMAGRDIRKYLRISHGDTIEILPTALERVQKGYGLLNLTVASQWVSLMARVLMSTHPVAVECMIAYDNAGNFIESDKHLRRVRDKGTGFTIGNKAQRGIPLYAFSYKTADEIDGMTHKLGMPKAYAVQIFACLSLSTCYDCLQESTIKALEAEAREGMIQIAFFSKCLTFRSDDVVM